MCATCVGYRLSRATLPCMYVLYSDTQLSGYIPISIYRHTCIAISAQIAIANLANLAFPLSQTTCTCVDEARKKKEKTGKKKKEKISI